MKRNANIIKKERQRGFQEALFASGVMNRFQAALSDLIEGPEKSHGAQSQQSGSPDHGVGAYLKARGADEG